LNKRDVQNLARYFDPIGRLISAFRRQDFEISRPVFGDSGCGEEWRGQTERNPVTQL
jgi:hypothetical protein